MTVIPLSRYQHRNAQACPVAFARSDNLVLPFLGPATQPSTLKLPLFTSKVPAGFPSPADDHLEAAIDLNRLCVQNPPATFFVRVEGHSMTGAGINDGDMLVVDRSLTAKHNSIVVAVVDGEVTVKCLDLSRGAVCLRARNPDYPDLPIKEGMDLHIWGVVAHVVRSLPT